MKFGDSNNKPDKPGSELMLPLNPLRSIIAA